MIKRLKNQDQQRKDASDQILCHQLTQLESYQNADTIATYLALPFEFNTQLLIEQAQKDDKTLLVPKTYSRGRMIFVVYDKTDLALTKFGLLEPQSEREVPKESIDLIHVPGLIFNSEGYRIGYGAGYYDRYLSDYSGRTVSTIYACQQGAFVPSAHDISVEKVLYD